jgi:tetratricopeptide (TPR) repeat protein
VIAVLLGALLVSAVVGCVGPTQTPVAAAAKRASAERLYDQGQFDDAIAPLTEIVSENPGDLVARRTLALALSASGDVTKAVSQYREILRRSPQDHESMYRLALLERIGGDLSEAERLLRAAIAIAPERATYREELAKTLAMASRFDEAAVIWRALLIRPGLGRDTAKAYYLGLADAYVGAGDLRAARAALAEALKRLPGDAELLGRLDAIR